MMLWELPKRSSHPEQCRNVIDLTKAQRFALSVFKNHPNKTRKELRTLIGFESAERACKRADELYNTGKLDRYHDKNTSEWRYRIKGE